MLYIILFTTFLVNTEQPLSDSSLNQGYILIDIFSHTLFSKMIFPPMYSENFPFSPVFPTHHIYPQPTTNNFKFLGKVGMLYEERKLLFESCMFQFSYGGLINFPIVKKRSLHECNFNSISCTSPVTTTGGGVIKPISRTRRDYSFKPHWGYCMFLYLY